MVVERIFVSAASGAPQFECERILVQAAMGIVGDRHFGKSAHRGQNLTLVEAEEIELFCAQAGRDVDLSLTRRNLVTRGVRLNDLVDVHFRVGPVLLRGVELCEPCAILGSALGSESLGAMAVVKHWVRRGGLRVDVVTDGEIGVGARIETDA